MIHVAPYGRHLKSRGTSLRWGWTLGFGNAASPITSSHPMSIRRQLCRRSKPVRCPSTLIISQHTVAHQITAIWCSLDPFLVFYSVPGTAQHSRKANRTSFSPVLLDCNREHGKGKDCHHRKRQLGIRYREDCRRECFPATRHL